MAKEVREIRFEMRQTEGENKIFNEAAESDGFKAISQWLRWLAARRIKEMERETKTTNSAKSAKR